MDTLPTVVLKRGEADRIIAGHPWVYHSSIDRLTTRAENGAIVQVKDHRQRFVGIGFYNAQSKINVRVIAHERLAVDQAFFEARISAALALRQKAMPQATSFRVVNAEADLLSGLIVDKYEDLVVIQISALGMEVRKREIVAALQKLLLPRAIIERSDVASRKFEGLAEANGVVTGETDGKVKVNLNGLAFETDLLSGHKTGLYLDQQENYRLFETLVRRLPAPHVLDCFSFLGGFALHAARAGAGHVQGIDQSAEAVAMAQRNASLNGFGEKCSFTEANVFDWLKAQMPTRAHERIIPRFDVIVLDPPSFTRNRASVHDALRGYKEIHLRSLKLLKPGGMLFTYCCSHHIPGPLFQDAILSAAYDARRILRRIGVFTQGPDHPVVPSIPETEYLKGFAFELISYA
jgi:23S rRNA (cytosine1962-C5)-methyltransferase